ncbi:hypothetical protein, partial [Ruegeria haliotis]|uniref:hypothetical protein n=1 Tax=Ruegeria haliotis TaxID=2747601 RepID=UPI001B7D7DBC
SSRQLEELNQQFSPRSNQSFSTKYGRRTDAEDLTNVRVQAQCDGLAAQPLGDLYFPELAELKQMYFFENRVRFWVLKV